jgi:putative FmdB family regulatory protein
MPLYEYECDNCGNRFERIQSVHDEPIKQCPNCAANALHKVFHPAGIIFKGSGWYINDSRKSASTETKSSSAPTTSTETKPTETKAETKSETKKESSESK